MFSDSRVCDKKRLHRFNDLFTVNHYLLQRLHKVAKLFKDLKVIVKQNDALKSIGNSVHRKRTKECCLD